jgi:hypothetical protein
MRRIFIASTISSVVLSVLVTLSLNIPINVPALIALFPLAWLIPSLGHAGPAVEIGFMWTEVHQWWVWVVF